MKIGLVKDNESISNREKGGEANLLRWLKSLTTRYELNRNAIPADDGRTRFVDDVWKLPKQFRVRSPNVFWAPSRLAEFGRAKYGVAGIE